MMRRILLLLLCTLAMPVYADDWRLKQNDDVRGIRVYQRPQANSGYQALYATTRVDSSVAEIESVLADIPAMSQWASRVQKAKLVKRKGDQAQIHIVYTLPYPFKPREVQVQLRRTVKAGVVNIRSSALPGSHRERAETVRLQALSSTWRLTPQADGGVKIELWGNAEPGGLVPAVLFNYNIADDAMQTMRHLRRMLQRDKYQDKAGQDEDSP